MFTLICDGFAALFVVGYSRRSHRIHPAPLVVVACVQVLPRLPGAPRALFTVPLFALSLFAITGLPRALRFRGGTLAALILTGLGLMHGVLDTLRYVVDGAPRLLIAAVRLIVPDFAAVPRLAVDLAHGRPTPLHPLPLLLLWILLFQVWIHRPSRLGRTAAVAGCLALLALIAYPRIYDTYAPNRSDYSFCMVARSTVH